MQIQPPIPAPGEYIAKEFTVGGLRDIRVRVGKCDRKHHHGRPCCVWRYDANERVDLACYSDDSFTNYRPVEGGAL